MKEKEKRWHAALRRHRIKLAQRRAEELARQEERFRLIVQSEAERLEKEWLSLSLTDKVVRLIFGRHWLNQIIAALTEMNRQSVLRERILRQSRI